MLRFRYQCQYIFKKSVTILTVIPKKPSVTSKLDRVKDEYFFSAKWMKHSQVEPIYARRRLYKETMLVYRTKLAV